MMLMHIAMNVDLDINPIKGIGNEYNKMNSGTITFLTTQKYSFEVCSVYEGSKLSKTAKNIVKQTKLCFNKKKDNCDYLCK